MIWNKRTCKREDGVLLMSAVNQPDNWDFPPDYPNPDMAVAISVPGDIFHIESLDEDTLLIQSTAGTFHLIGNPADGGRIVEIKP